eukprot:m.591895 g.591895  ORF g.591895 m.591895 type:complete len:335 (-) comp22387_c0_seq2:183-1187(-)
MYTSGVEVCNYFVVPGRYQKEPRWGRSGIMLLSRTPTESILWLREFCRDLSWSDCYSWIRVCVCVCGAGGRLHAIEQCVFTGLPSDDTHDIYLALSDATDSLRGRPEYRIMFRAGALWDASRGLHVLSTVSTSDEASTQTLFDAPQCTAVFTCTVAAASDYGTQLSVLEIAASLRPAPTVPVEPVEGNLIQNPSFEMGTAEWSTFSDGFSVDDRSRSGHLSVLVSNGAARQTVAFASPYPTALNLSGCSLPLAVTGATTRSGNYAVYSDAVLSDGSPLYGQNAEFSPTESDYHCEFTVISAPSGIQSLTVYTMFRNLGGSAVFDDIALLDISVQ